MNKTKRASTRQSGTLPLDRSVFTAGVELDDDVNRARDARIAKVKSTFMAMLDRGDGQGIIDAALDLLVSAERANDHLTWQILRAIRHRFGRSTEKLSRDELRQLVLALGGDEEAAKAPEPIVPQPEAPREASSDDDAATPDDKPEKKSRERINKTRVAAHVERIVDTDMRVEGDDRVCATCGGDKATIGVIEHERFEFVASKIVVHVERREKCACKVCCNDVTAADRTSEWTRKIGPTLLAKLVVDKCVYAMPLYRQHQELERMGYFTPIKTLETCWAYTLDALEAVAVMLRSNVFGSAIVAADDSHLKTIAKSAKTGIFKGHLWCFVGTDGTPGGCESVAYGYAESWKASEIAAWFAAIDGDVQCDGYAGYATKTVDAEGDVFVAVPNERRLGCGMHIRRKFHDALLGKDMRAAIALDLIAKIYVIEAECKASKLNAQERGEVRRAQSIPIFDKLYKWIDELHPKLLPKAPLYEATTYATGQKAFWRRCFEDGRFEIDNGRVERRIRPFAVGRRNFLFTGSVRGGERLADAYTIVDSCLRIGVDPQTYIADLLIKLDANWPMRRLSELAPANWSAARNALSTTVLPAESTVAQNAELASSAA